MISFSDGYFKKKLKPKKCKNCENKFEPFTSLSMCCSIKCSLEYNKKKQAENETKEWLKKKRVMKEKLMSHSDWLNKLQKVFNEFIRLRDKDQKCICCDKPLGENYHGGHFKNVGSNPGLRFDEDNCFGQRIDCNLYKHGNQDEYARLLPLRIGQKRYDALLERRKQKPKKYSVPEIKELIKKYRLKIKELK